MYDFNQIKIVANITGLMDFSFIIGALLRSNLDFQL